MISKKIKLKEVVQFSKGKKPLKLFTVKTENAIPYIDIKAFEKRTYDQFCMDSEKVTLANKNDILVVWDGARCGLVGFAEVGAVGSTLMRLSPKDNYNSKFLYYFLQSKYSEIQQNPRGVGIPHVEPSLFWNFEIPDYDLTLQNALVQKIDTLFSHLNEGESILRNIQKQLEIYKQSVLSKAFGRTNEDNSGDVLHSLPSGWKWVKFNDIGSIGRGKSKHRPRNDKSLFGGKYPFIQTGEVRSANKYVTRYSNTYNEIGLKQSKLWPKNTLLITIAANIADTAILTFEACFPDSVVGFIADESKCTVEYIEFFIRTIKENLNYYAPATAQKNINLKILNDVYIPLPPLEQQILIVQRLNEIVSIIDKQSEEIEQNRSSIKLTKKSILNKAFNGELV